MKFLLLAAALATSSSSTAIAAEAQYTYIKCTYITVSKSKTSQESTPSEKIDFIRLGDKFWQIWNPDKGTWYNNSCNNQICTVSDIEYFHRALSPNIASGGYWNLWEGHIYRKTGKYKFTSTTYRDKEYFASIEGNGSCESADNPENSIKGNKF